MRKPTILLFIGLLFLLAMIGPTTANRLLAYTTARYTATTILPRLTHLPFYDRQQNSPTGQPQSLSTSPGFLSGPNVGAPLDIALQYIHQNAAHLGLSEADLTDLVVKDQYTTQHNGVTHLYLRQRYHGIEVYNADININISRNGEVINLGNRFVPALAQAINTDVPQLTPSDAVVRVAQRLQLAVTAPLQVLEDRNGPAREVQLTGNGISADAIPVQLLYQPQPDGKVRLAWSTVIRPPGTTQWWHSRVDAVTGVVLAQNDWVDHEQWAPVAASETQDTPTAQDTTATDAVNPPQPASPLAPPSYRIFALPLENPNDGQGLPNSQTLVKNAADTVASPYGWHDIDGLPGHEFTDTQGNNVAAQEDTNADDVGGFRPTGKKPAKFNFDYTFDPQQEPAGGVNQSVAIVNLFYWNNIIHDLFYHYGFDEASGNFQENNYGHDGLGADAVQADAQDGAGLNNANFGTPPDGLRPRMQMFNFNLTTPYRDGDLDNGIIIHEYGHGISTRLTGGPSNVGCLDNAEQMGEGWSDWFTLVLTAKAGDTGAKGRGVGTYVLGQPLDGPGIRRVRYSTDMNIDPQTYNTIKESGEVHDVGEVWATMLWEMYWALVDQQGFDPNLYTGQGGNNLALQLVMDGLKLQPCSPGFVDGRDAILLADQVNNGGANQCAIWGAFAKRGLGASANQGSSSSTTDGQAAFDIPVTCLDELLLTLHADPPTIQAGQMLTYTLVAGNYLSSSLTNVVIQDVIPADTTYVSGSASDGGSEAGGVVSWPAVTLAPDQVITRTFQVLVATTIPDVTTITNTATVTSQEGVTATATVQTVAIRAPDIAVAPTALEATLVGGDKVTQTLTISNLGTKPLAFTLAEFDGGNMLTGALVPSTAPTTNADRGQTAVAYNTLPAVAHDLTGYQPKAGALGGGGGGGAAPVLLLASADVFQLQTILQAYPDTNLVDIFDARLATPLLADLQTYAVIVVIAGNAFVDPVALGDVLADYIDNGGKVVQTVPTFYDPFGSGWGLQGRFVTDGYSPFIGTGDWFLSADLGAFDATHPIMQGVTQANDYFRQIMEVAPDAEVVANWTDDEFVATKGSVVALNAYLADGYAWTGDVDLIVHNSIIWLQDQAAPDHVPWLTATPVTGTVESGASQTLAVAFDTAVAAITQAGDYYATLKVRSDDPDEPTVSVPITLHVVGPALTISDTQSYVGRTVDVPVVFNSNGLAVAATAFSVDYAEECLSFDPTDNNNDGIPDAITINAPADLTVYVKATTDDTDGELDFFIADTTPPFAALPDGAVANIKLTVICLSVANDGAPLRIGFSSDPVASFSNADGRTMPGRTQEGAITVLPGQLGDCNQDGVVNASDSISCVLELLDGDGDFWLDAPGGSFPGSPQGCDSNADSQINAADLICTVITIFEGPGQCAAGVRAASVDAPAASLSLPQGIAAKAGEPLAAPVVFTGNGQRVAAAVFALRLDDPQLTFDPADNNGDGIPDAVALTVPAGFATTVKFDAERKQLYFVLADLTPPFALLPDGPLATVTLGVNPPTDGQTGTAAIAFAVDTRASLGADNGQSAAVVTQDGSVQINGVNDAALINKLYLPTVLR